MIAANRVSAETEEVAPEKAGPRRMLNEKQLLKIVPVGHATLWRLVKAGKFPKGSLISANRKIWFEDEILAWQNAVEGQSRPKP